MKLLTIGDSFTYGTELSDPSKHAWPVLLSQACSADLRNISAGGFSNDAMFRECVEQVSHDGYDVVIVAWTDPARMEITRSGQPFSVNLSPRMCKLVPWLEQYYLYNQDDEHSYRRTLTMIVACQEFLKSCQQPYVFVSTFGLQVLHKVYEEKYRSLHDKIDKENYPGWPGEGIVEWMGDCPKAPGGHPLELGHQRIAEKINEHIRNISRIP